MRIVVTGSEGFIGTHLCRRLAVLGHDVYGIDLKSERDVLHCDLPSAELVFHLAAQTDALSRDFEADARVNVMGLLRVLARYGNRTVFASSSMVHYPVTPYAISKRAGELYAALSGASVVRLCNIFGPGGHSVIDRFSIDEFLTIRGDGDQRRSYAHVDEAVDLFVSEIDYRQPLRVLQGEAMTVLQVADRYGAGKPRQFSARSEFDLVNAVQC